MYVLGAYIYIYEDLAVELGKNMHIIILKSMKTIGKLMKFNENTCPGINGQCAGQWSQSECMGVPWIAQNDDFCCVREPGPPAASPGGCQEGIYIEKC